MRHQRLDEYECARRRSSTDAWLDLVDDSGWDAWRARFRDRWCEERILETATPEQIAARKAAKDAANARAEQLLCDTLSAAQLREYKRRGYFHVVVGNRRFRITRGRTHNIKEVDTRGRIRKSLCAHPTIPVPDHDTMLAQKLWLEYKPEEFLKIANVMRPPRPCQSAPQWQAGGDQWHVHVRRAQEAALDATALGVEPAANDGRAA